MNLTEQRLVAEFDVTSAVDDAFRGLTIDDLAEVPRLGTLSRSSFVALDTNALVATVERGNGAILQGRAPIVSITAAKEYLAGRGSPAALRTFLDVHSGRIGAAGPEHLAIGLQTRAVARGRVLSRSDARVAANAVVEDVPLVTFDRRFSNFLREFGWRVEP